MPCRKDQIAALALIQQACQLCQFDSRPLQGTPHLLIRMGNHPNYRRRPDGHGKPLFYPAKLDKFHLTGFGDKPTSVQAAYESWYGIDVGQKKNGRSFGFPIHVRWAITSCFNYLVICRPDSPLAKELLNHLSFSVHRLRAMVPEGHYKDFISSALDKVSHLKLSDPEVRKAIKKAIRANFKGCDFQKIRPLDAFESHQLPKTVNEAIKIMLKPDRGTILVKVPGRWCPPALAHDNHERSEPERILVYSPTCKGGRGNV